MNTFLLIEIQDSISIPVAYIEAVVMMFISFLIGYIGASVYGKIKARQHSIATTKTIDTLKKQVAILTAENERIPEDRFQKDRMDQEFEQVQFQKRAFSEHVLAETVEVLQPKGINFDLIGRASKDDKDDLQKIIGVGPYTETKLNDLGIYTYKQISKFSNEDVAAVTELIKFFPDRIKNDRWVAKAQDLEYKKSQIDEESTSPKKKMMNEKTT